MFQIELSNRAPFANFDHVISDASKSQYFLIKLCHD